MISVLIITRRRTALLQKCLAAIAAQSDTCQVIVVVNGPDAETQDWLASAQVPGLEWMVLPEPLAPGAARNAGLERVRGEWTFLLDDDAVITPGYLARFHSEAEKLPEADVIGGPDAAPPESKGLPYAVSLTLASPFCTGATFRRHRSKGQRATPASEIELTSCNLWVKSHWWRQGLRFPVDYRRGEETVLLKELQDRGARLWWLPNLVVWHTRRDEWQALLRASWGGGFHRARVLQEQGGPRWFWLSALFVLLHFTVLAMPPLFIFLAACWLVMVGSVAFMLCQEARTLHLWPLVVVLHWALPFSYGVGFLQRQWDRS